MMEPLTIVVLLALGLAGLVALASGVVRVFRRRLVTGGGLTTLGAALAGAAALGLGLASNLYTYNRFTHEQAVVDLNFERLADQRYRVAVIDPQSGVQHWEVGGDEWQLDVRLLRWQGKATLLGLDPLYRLERLSGRYRDLQREREAPRSVHALNPSAGLDLWQLAKGYEEWLPFVDAAYGSATYLPMADKAQYTVTINANGLVARPANEAAKEALRRW
ncbi:MAG: cation/multidrug efflux pump [Pseudomonadota bacterium]|nr:MAG: cation/multidrug efflux pump [Pseudomonadota bacterium]